MLLRSGRRLGTLEEAARATVPRRRSRSRHDLFAGIPEEILLDILARLPAKSVLRCRAVCQLLRRLASEPAFLLDHHRRQPELHLISSYRTADGADNFPRLEAVHLQGAEFRPFFKFPQLFGSDFSVIDASCDGLFVVGEYICNPATRQWALIRANPNLGIGNLVGLYRHEPSGEYRVVYWRRSNLPLDVFYCPVEYRVLTVGTNQSRRVDSSTLDWLGLRIFGVPILLYGSLHLHTMSVYHRIVVFDTVSETFRYMRPPPVNPHHVMHLFDMGGTLAASTNKDGMTGMRIFMLQDREHDAWAFQYRIELPVMDIRRFQEKGDFWAKVVSDEGDVLVSCYGQLLHCDKKGNLVANFKYDDDMPVVLPHRLKESLVQHTFFKKTEN
jgi:F-box interacting protein